jgi:hypothetical protein
MIEGTSVPFFSFVLPPFNLGYFPSFFILSIFFFCPDRIFLQVSSAFFNSAASFALALACGPPRLSSAASSYY